MNRYQAPRKRLSALVLAGGVAIAACGSDSDGTTDTVANPGTTEETDTADTNATGTTAAASEASDGSTLAGVEAAQWSDTVTITIGDDSFRFESNGIPDHELPDQFLVPQQGSFSPPVDESEVNVTDTDVAVVESPVDQTITLNPVYSETTSDTNLGLIGVFFVDSCNGHPLALNADGAGQGNYHYHGVPYCLTDVVDIDGEHSSILGFLVDGFAFYGPQDEGGVTITSDDLDECSGHVGPTPEFPEGIYHYHLTEDRSPYTVDCYHGEVASSTEGGDPGGPPAGDDGGGGGAPDFSDAAETLGVTADDLTAALGQPPFDLDAAAATLGVSAADLEAALPAPPGDGGGPPADGEAPDEAPEGAESAGDDASADVADIDPDELDTRTAVVMAAQWADNVTITVDGSSIRFESDGLPSHEYLDTYLADGRDGKYIAGGVESYDANFTFPIVPTVADTPSSTGNGAIGVAISGAVFFDPFEGDGSDTIANDDNSTIDGIPFIDACGGHPLPSTISYHYHGIPFCITDAVDTEGEHSVLIGYLFDGYGIYGPQDVNGDEPTDLDACLGHVGPTPEFEEDTYHYHVTSTANYISECLTGNV